jgi:nitroreductase
MTIIQAQGMTVTQAIYGRRSIRKYKSLPVSTQDLRDILEAGVHAPSGINMQPWYFLAVQSEEAMARLKKLMEKTFENFLPILQKRFARNPEAIEEAKPFLSDLGGAPVCILAFLLKQPKDDPNYSEVLTLSQCVAAGIQNMLLTAQAKGLGSCWMTAPINAGLGEEIRKEFASEHGQLIACATIGYPDEAPQMPERRSDRYSIIMTIPFASLRHKTLMKRIRA